LIIPGNGYICAESQESWRAYYQRRMHSRNTIEDELPTEESFGSTAAIYDPELPRVMK